jgi:hypothetical protein
LHSSLILLVMIIRVRGHLGSRGFESRWFGKLVTTEKNWLGASGFQELLAKAVVRLGLEVEGFHGPVLGREA